MNPTFLTGFFAAVFFVATFAGGFVSALWLLRTGNVAIVEVTDGR